MRIRFLVPTAASANGYTVMHFQPGDEFDLPDQVALGLIGAGNAEDPDGLVVAPKDQAIADDSDAASDEGHEGADGGEVAEVAEGGEGGEGAEGQVVEPSPVEAAPVTKPPGRPRRT